jgi:hypothetical protein
MESNNIKLQRGYAAQGDAFEGNERLQEVRIT